MIENIKNTVNNLEDKRYENIVMPPLPEEPVVEEAQEAAQEDAPEVEETPVTPPSETEQQKNFRQLKEKALRAERERDDLMRKLKEVEAAKTPVKDEEEFTLAPDDLAEGKHLSKVQQKIKSLESKIAQYEQRTSEQIIEAQIKSQYPDFDAVVSADTLNQLKDEEPELFNALNSTVDLYSKAVSAYKMVKKLGIAKEAPTQKVNPDVVRAQKNLAKPKPIASISPQRPDSPLSHANAFAEELTADLKKQHYKEMMEARKGY